MASPRQELLDRISTLTDEEARRTIVFVDGLRGDDDTARLRRLLAGDPAFRVPASGTPRFREVKPARGKGQPASKLLVADRR